jgi:two-component system invasion response regulator UvrY
MIRVLIADDHTIVRSGLRQLLNDEADVETVGEARNGNEVLELLSRAKVDVVVLDISMPGRNGLDTLKEIRKQYPAVSVVVLSMHPKDQYAVRILKAGAAAYVTKESAPDELVRAIRRAAGGHKYITPDVAEMLADFLQNRNPDEPHRLLTDRELQVFMMVAAGKSSSLIANELNLSIKTISTYKSRIVEKTGLNTSSEITRYSIEHGLLK